MSHESCGLPRLTREFYNAPSPVVARRVLGKRLVRVVRGRRLAGLIVETEAYRNSDDPASHAFRGPTKRNSVMFGEPGHAYVYLSYGLNQCLNLTCEPAGVAAAVLVRALQPAEGIGEMMSRRGTDRIEDLASGPGKLTEALGIGPGFNGEDLVRSGRLFLEQMEPIRDPGTSSRVGITAGTEQAWRFYARGNRFVSRGRPAAAAQNP